MFESFDLNTTMRRLHEINPMLPVLRVLRNLNGDSCILYHAMISTHYGDLTSSYRSSLLIFVLTNVLLKTLYIV